MTDHNLAQRLAKRGWRQIGSGYFATVYGRCNDNGGTRWVIKTGPADDGWLDYAMFLKATERQWEGNPFVPVIRSLKVTDGFYVAVIERLDCTASDCGDYAALDDMRDFLADSRFMSIERKLTMNPLLVEFLTTLRIEFAGSGWDVHGGNVMFRGTQPVLTDPLAFTVAGPASTQRVVRLSRYRMRRQLRQAA